MEKITVVDATGAGRRRIPTPIDGGPDTGSMTRAAGSPTRRAAVRTMTALVALATSVTLAGCGADRHPATGCAGARYRHQRCTDTPAHL